MKTFFRALIYYVIFKVKKLFEFDYPPLKGGGIKPNSWLRHHNFFYNTGKA